jgi:hypothetical protein
MHATCYWQTSFSEVYKTTCSSCTHLCNNEKPYSNMGHCNKKWDVLESWWRGLIIGPHLLPPWEGASPSRERRGNDQNTQAHGVPMVPNTSAKPPTYGNHPHKYLVQPINGNSHATLCPNLNPEHKAKATKMVVVN